MTRQELEPWQLRTARFEMVEERLVLSADPLPALVLHGELVSAVQDELVSYEHHTLDLENASALAPHLGGVNSTTGVNYVHSQYGFDGAGQTVAVIDSGIAWDHYNLGRGFGANYRVVGGWDFAENDAHPYDDAPAGFHGTHVAGIIGSDHATNTGVAPGADLVALRVFNDAGQGNFAWVESALQWVIAHHDDFDNPITTVNMSLGVPAMNGTSIPNWAMLENELQTLNTLGIFVAVSAGNDFTQFNAQGLSYPAVSQWVVPVASANDAGTAMSSFSQRDDRVLVAPGETITSTVPDALFSFNGVANDWASASGTSMASPYVAGASVLLREAFWSIGVSNVDQDMIYDVLFDTADLIYDPITAASYHCIDVDAAVAAVLANAGGGSGGGNQQLPPPPPTDLGSVDYRLVNDTTVAGERWFHVTASRSALFTVEARSAGQQNIDVQIYNAAQQLLGDGANVAGYARADAPVAAGQTLLVRMVGHSSDTDLTLANLVSVTGTQIDVHGTSIRDDLYMAAGSQHQLNVNGVGYSFAASAVRTINVHGHGGSDSFNFSGTSAAETAEVSVGSTTITGTNLKVKVLQVEGIGLGGGGGKDVVRMYDSGGNDELTSTLEYMRLVGPGFHHTTYGFSTATAYGNNGGADRAMLYDSAGNETFTAKPLYAQLTGLTFSYIAHGFENVKAFASQGTDKAVFSDSSGNDEFVAQQSLAKLTGPGFKFSARGFDDVRATASGGHDTAVFYDVFAPHQWVSRSTYASLRGPGFYNYASRFDQVVTHAIATQARPASLGLEAGASFANTDCPSDQADNFARDTNSINGHQRSAALAHALYFESLGERDSLLRSNSGSFGNREAAAATRLENREPAPSSGVLSADQQFVSEPTGNEAATIYEHIARTDIESSGTATNGELDHATKFAVAELAAVDFLFFTLSEGL